MADLKQGAATFTGMIRGTLRQWWGRIRYGRRYPFKAWHLYRAFREKVEPWDL